MMNALRANLNVAFDTTALALILSIGLMFAMFVVTRVESDLLKQVDDEVRAELAKSFLVTSQENDAYVRTVQRIGRTIVAATHEMSQKQIEVWRRSIETAQAAWIQSTQMCYELVQSSLAKSLEQSLAGMSSELATTIRNLDASLLERGRQWQENLVEAAEQIAQQHRQASLDQQQAAEILRQAGQFDDPTLKLRLADLIDSLNLLSSRLQHSGHSAEASSRPDEQAVAGEPVRLRVVAEDVAA
jgi:hypothetical protein